MKIIQFQFVNDEEIYGLGDDGVLYIRDIHAGNRSYVWEPVCKPVTRHEMNLQNPQNQG